MDATEIIRALGGPAAIAERICRPRNTVDYWCRRDGIPAAYWPALVGLAREWEVPEVTLEVLAAHRAAPPSQVEQQVGATA